MKLVTQIEQHTGLNQWYVTGLNETLAFFLISIVAKIEKICKTSA
ncbi:hypothetical protein HDC92_001762 [Pedobacter sp. AK017]|nr:hypothetical protein [Pedobacter sp. AK017]